MKKLLLIIGMTALLITAILVGGCSDNSEPNFGEHGAKVYEPSLSAMSDEAIRIKVDELYDKYVTSFEAIQVLQNELILRQLEAMNADEADKQPEQPHAKQGIKGLEHKGLQDKQSLKGFGKNAHKGN